MVMRWGYQPTDLSLMLEVFGPIALALFGVTPCPPDARDCIHHRLKVPEHLGQLILVEVDFLIHLKCLPTLMPALPRVASAPHRQWRLVPLQHVADGRSWPETKVPGPGVARS